MKTEVSSIPPCYYKTPKCTVMSRSKGLGKGMAPSTSFNWTKGTRAMALPLYQVQSDRTHARSLRQRGFNLGDCCYMVLEVQKNTREC